MKILETTFRGCRFRSRLEARWAVFMHTLGVPYVYEPEAYELDGLYYLPDFWLPQQDCFLEIKPEDPTEEESEKASRLAIGTKKHVLICFSSLCVPDFGPAHNSMHLFFPDVGWDCYYQWCECRYCGRIGIEFTGRSERLSCSCHRDMAADDPNADSPRLVRAYEAAAGFRFY
jgi:hypothetical protein